MSRILLLILGAVLLGYLGLALLVFANQRAMLFPAPAQAREPRLAGATLLRLEGPEGAPVLALHVPAPPGARTVAHFHGNAEQLADVVPLARRFQEAGLGFYAVEYPGYGLAAGTKPSEAGLYAAAEVALEHLRRAQGVPPEDTVLQGQSLGSGVAVEMARRGHGARLVLLTPYTSIVEMGARVVPWLPARLLVRDRFDNAAKAPGVGLPVLILHGTRDEVVPVDMGQRLGTLFPRATVHTVEGASHDDVLERQGAFERLLRFARGQALSEGGHGLGP